MKKQTAKLILTLILGFLGCTSYAQESGINVIDSSAVVNRKLNFGCGFGLNFMGGTNISIAPNLIYSVSNKVSIGGGLQGSYTAIKDVQNTTVFGINVIGQYSPVKKLTTLLEFAELNVKTKIETVATAQTEKFWESALFIGAGYNITKNISAGAKYNVLYKDDESVYTSAIIPFVNVTF